MEMLILGLISTIISLWLGGMEIRMRNLDNKLRDVPTRKEVASEVEVRLRATKVLQREIKEDIREIKQQLEKLNQKLS